MTISIDSTNNSLTGIVNAINAQNAGENATGVTASAIHDGTQYRMVLSGDSVTESNIKLDASGLTEGAGSYANPAFAVYSGGSGLPEHEDGEAASTQHAQRAEIIVDGITIEGDTNTFTEAIPGITLGLVTADAGETIEVSVGFDEGALKNKIGAFVSAYNSVVGFVDAQSAKEGGIAGVLVGDSGVLAIRRRVHRLLVTPVDDASKLSTLSELGLEVQENGTIKLDEAKFSAAVESDLDGVVKLLAGGDGSDGVVTRFESYLGELTDSADGFLAGRKQAIDANMKRVDRTIERLELRLARRQETLEKRFTALEMMMSSLNAQGDYVSQQMDALSTMWKQRK